MAHNTGTQARSGALLQPPAVVLSPSATIVITHYQRLLEYIVPDRVHVLSKGRIVKSGGRELALALEEQGYGWLNVEPEPA